VSIKLIHCSGSDVSRYVRFCRDVYSDDVNYRDSMGSLCFDILSGRSVFSKAAWILPVMVLDAQDQILAVATFIQAKAMSDVLQMSFFEAVQTGEHAADLIVTEAAKMAIKRHARRIVVGINGHINYGLGFLADHYHERTGFGSAYNPRWYVHYFEKRAVRTSTLVSYLGDPGTQPTEREQRLIRRLERTFTFRMADLRHLEREIVTYTQLNNDCFATHPLYYERRVEEDYELFRAFRRLLREENLLFAEKNGKAVAFMLWYPDFNELVPPGGTLGVRTWIQYKLLRRPITRFKIVEIGVHPDYQRSGVIIGLFDQCLKQTRGRFAQCESGWIFSDNMDSRALCERWAAKPYKHYKVFELPVDGRD
jgi:hypothetical protein